MYCRCVRTARGGAFRLTLVFDTPGETGTRKSSPSTDVVDGEFLEPVPNEMVRSQKSGRGQRSVSEFAIQKN